MTVVVGSPNYLSEFTAYFRALYERLFFQSLTYNRQHENCNEHMIPVLLIMASNAHDTMYVDMVEKYKRNFERFVGPTTTWISGNTIQINDYSKTDWEWTYFDVESKKKRHEEVFPKERKKSIN